MNGHDLSEKNHRRVEYTVVTSKRIPMNLDETLCSNYDKQLAEGINLPTHLMPENNHCKHGYISNREAKLKLENTGIVIYVTEDVGV